MPRCWPRPRKIVIRRARPVEALRRHDISAWHLHAASRVDTVHHALLERHSRAPALEDLGAQLEEALFHPRASGIVVPLEPRRHPTYLVHGRTEGLSAGAQGIAARRANLLVFQSRKVGGAAPAQRSCVALQPLFSLVDTCADSTQLVLRSRARLGVPAPIKAIFALPAEATPTISEHPVVVTDWHAGVWRRGGSGGSC